MPSKNQHVTEPSGTAVGVHDAPVSCTLCAVSDHCGQLKFHHGLLAGDPVTNMFDTDLFARSNHLPLNIIVQ